VRWETDWSSQTGVCQADLLHGDNDDMPAFRWLVTALRDHPGIGFVFVRSERHEAVALGGGRNTLSRRGPRGGRRPARATRGASG